MEVNQTIQTIISRIGGGHKLSVQMNYIGQKRCDNQPKKHQ
jgi:hypothetical protein